MTNNWSAMALLSPSFLWQRAARYKKTLTNQHWLCGIKTHLNEEMSDFKPVSEMEGIAKGKKVKLAKVIDEENRI